MRRITNSLTVVLDISCLICSISLANCPHATLLSGPGQSQLYYRYRAFTYVFKEVRTRPLSFYDNISSDIGLSHVIVKPNL